MPFLHSFLYQKLFFYILNFSAIKSINIIYKNIIKCFLQLRIFCCGKPKSQKNVEERYFTPKILFFKTSEVVPQQFSLPKPYMCHLLKNANVELIKKFQQCCRYFYSKFNFNIIHNLETSFDGKALKISNFNIRIPDNQVAFFQNKLYLNKKLSMSGRCKFLKELYPKIVKCDISELVISTCGRFTIDNLEVLTKSSNLKILRIYCNIYYSDTNNTRAPLEAILSYVPNVSEFM